MAKSDSDLKISVTSSSGGTATTLMLPEGCPLYVPIPEAAQIAGVSAETMRAWCDRADEPIPHMVVGKATNRTSKKLVSVAAIPDYCRSKESR